MNESATEKANRANSASRATFHKPELGTYWLIKDDIPMQRKNSTTLKKGKVIFVFKMAPLTKKCQVTYAAIIA